MPALQAPRLRHALVLQVRPPPRWSTARRLQGRAWAGQPQTRQNITQRCCDIMELGRNARDGPLVRHGPD